MRTRYFGASVASQDALLYTPQFCFTSTPGYGVGATNSSTFLFAALMKVYDPLYPPGNDPISYHTRKNWTLSQCSSIHRLLEQSINQRRRTLHGCTTAPLRALARNPASGPFQGAPPAVCRLRAAPIRQACD